MQSYQVEATVSSDGVLTIRGVPFRAGDRVQVIVRRRRDHEAGKELYALRGKPVRYTAPFESVAEDEWGSLQ